MFTAILAEASEKPSETGLFSYAIVYTDNVSMKYEKRYTTDTLTDDLIQQVATAEIKRLNNTISAKRTITPGVEIPVLQPTAPEVTPEQKAQAGFLAKYRQLRGFIAAAADGVVPADHPAISRLQKELAGEWMDAYAEHISRG